MANTNQAQKRKQTRKRVVAVIAVVLLVLLCAVLYVRQRVQRSVTAQSSSNVKTASVTVGSIETAVSGTGTLVSENVEDLSVPSTVKVEEIFVEQGDEVEAGTLLASVNKSTVLTTLSTVQKKLDNLDSDIHSASNNKVSSTINAGVPGRVKAIYAEKGDDVATVMYEKGALALLSMDGYLAVDLDDTGFAPGETVTVTDSEGKEWEGTVDCVAGQTATILITDDGPLVDSEVTVNGQKGTLYIHKPLKVTGYTGTIQSVVTRENAKVYSTYQLFSLKDTDDTAEYDQLLADRKDYEELYQKLVKLYKDGGLVAEAGGTIQSVTDLDTVTVGSDPQEDTVLASLDPCETMSVTISVDETDILSLKVGQEVTVTVDSIGDLPYTGTVTEVDPTGTEGAYSAKVCLSKDKNMLSGMTADVDVTIEGVENALLLPVDAVKKTSATAYVYTTYDADTDTLGGMVEVQLGLSNGTLTEIVSGLKQGDTVYYTPKEQTFTFGGMTITTSGDFSPMDGGMGGGRQSGKGQAGMPGGMPGGIPSGGMPAGMPGMGG